MLHRLLKGIWQSTPSPSHKLSQKDRNWWRDTRLVCHLYWLQKAAVRVGTAISDYATLKRGVRQGCVLSPYLFNIYTEYIFRESNDLDGLKINEHNTNNIRYADDTTLIVENEEGLHKIVSTVCIQYKKDGTGYELSIAGIQSSSIRQRLLESSEDSLEQLFRTATTMELATKDAQLIIPTESQATPNSLIIAAINKASCLWCGGSIRHNRISCPANSSIYKKCSKKRHWASACLSKQHLTPSKKTLRSMTAALDLNTREELDELGHQDTVATVLAAMSTSNGLVTASINGFSINALKDSESDLLFVTDSFMKTHRLKYKVTHGRRIALANTTSFQVIGEFNASITLDAKSYMNKLLVVKSLVAPCVIGRDILVQHSSVSLEMGGPRRPVIFCLLMSKMNCPMYDLVLGCDLSKCRPIATPSCFAIHHTLRSLNRRWVVFYKKTSFKRARVRGVAMFYC